MSSVRTRHVAARDDMGAGGLRATNWPLRDDPARSLAYLASCLLIAGACAALSQSVSMGLLTGLALLLAFWKLWIPIATEIEPRGVVLSVLGRRRHLSWREIDHLELREGGVFLCPEPPPLRRGLLSNVFLPWGKNRQAIRTFCDSYRPLGMRGQSGESTGSG